MSTLRDLDVGIYRLRLCCQTTRSCFITDAQLSVPSEAKARDVLLRMGTPEAVPFQNQVMKHLLVLQLHLLRKA